MRSTIGRPRAVTDEQVAAILAWHDAILAWKAQRKMLKTLRQLSRELELPMGTINDVIRRRGEFKQASPEHREKERERRRERMRQIHPRAHR